MIWDNYVLRRGDEVEELWDQLASDRALSGSPVNLLYIAGKGFDRRAEVVMRRYLDRLQASGVELTATLVLISFSAYELDDELVELTRLNAQAMTAMFRSFGDVVEIDVGSSLGGETDITPTASLRDAAGKVVALIEGKSDVVLDVSSLSRNAYLTLLLRILGRLVGYEAGAHVINRDVTFQVLAGEDAQLDSRIRAEDLGNELVLIPGYSEGLHSEAVEHQKLVWFPVLGENRVAQLAKVEIEIPPSAEVCPILPHPSVIPRRGDRLLVEYEDALFARRNIGANSIVYAHEAHPFEAYRQVLNAMKRFHQTFSILGGCRIVLTPLASKLITVGSALACFEVKTSRSDGATTLSVAIANAEPRRYSVSTAEMAEANPTLSSLVLTGRPYALT